jgi:hypothetical protein
MAEYYIVMCLFLSLISAMCLSFADSQTMQFTINLQGIFVIGILIAISLVNSNRTSAK